MDSFEVNFAFTYLKPQQQKSPCHFRKNKLIWGEFEELKGEKLFKETNLGR